MGWTANLHSQEDWNIEYTYEESSRLEFNGSIGHANLVQNSYEGGIRSDIIKEMSTFGDFEVRVGLTIPELSDYLANGGDLYFDFYVTLSSDISDGIKSRKYFDLYLYNNSGELYYSIYGLTTAMPFPSQLPWSGEFIFKRVGTVASAYMGDTLLWSGDSPANLEANVSGLECEWGAYVLDESLYPITVPDIRVSSMSVDGDTGSCVIGTLNIFPESGVEIYPTVNSSTFSYTAVCRGGVDKVSFLIDTADKSAETSVTVNGVSVPKGIESSLFDISEGLNEFEILLTTSDGRTALYTIDLTNYLGASGECILREFEIIGATLSNFDSKTFQYNVSLSGESNVVTRLVYFNFVPSKYSTVRVGGMVVDQSDYESLKVIVPEGSSVTEIEVTAEDGFSKSTYQISFTTDYTSKITNILAKEAQFYYYDNSTTSTVRLGYHENKITLIFKTVSPHAIVFVNGVEVEKGGVSFDVPTGQTVGLTVTVKSFDEKYSTVRNLSISRNTSASSNTGYSGRYASKTFRRYPLSDYFPLQMMEFNSSEENVEIGHYSTNPSTWYSFNGSEYSALPYLIESIPIGETTIVVDILAEDRVTTRQESFKIKRTLASDSSLFRLRVICGENGSGSVLGPVYMDSGGVVPEFSPSTMEYEIVGMAHYARSFYFELLPNDPSAEVSATANGEYCRISKDFSASPILVALPGESVHFQVKVDSADGSSTSYYNIRGDVPKHYQYAYGDGTEANPYQIWTAEDLDAMRYYNSNILSSPSVLNPTNSSHEMIQSSYEKVMTYFKQMADIDLSGYDNWNPIQGPTFRDEHTSTLETALRISPIWVGRFDGNNHTIRNLKSYVDIPSNSPAVGGIPLGELEEPIEFYSSRDRSRDGLGSLGLFGVVSANFILDKTLDTPAIQSSWLRNIRIENADIRFRFGYRAENPYLVVQEMGILAGYVSHTLIDNCVVSGELEHKRAFVSEGGAIYISDVNYPETKVGGLVGIWYPSKDAPFLRRCSSDVQIDFYGSGYEDTKRHTTGGLIGHLPMDYKSGYTFKTDMVRALDSNGVEECFSNYNIDLHIIQPPEGMTIGGQKSVGCCIGGLVGRISNLYYSILAPELQYPNEYYVIRDCYTVGSISSGGSIAIGGFIGHYNCNIKNCYTISTVGRGQPWTAFFDGLIDTTEVVTPQSIGCFVGMKTNMYNKKVPVISNSYALNICSGSDDVQYKSVEEMRDRSTFAGWDFDTVWKIDNSNGGFPSFQWVDGGGFSCSAFYKARE